MHPCRIRGHTSEPTRPHELALLAASSAFCPQSQSRKTKSTGTFSLDDTIQTARFVAGARTQLVRSAEDNLGVEDVHTPLLRGKAQT
jgi:hypothetical protein